MTYNRSNRTANAVMTEAKVILLRQLAAEGVPTRELSDKFGIGNDAVRAIVRRDSWKWLGIDNSQMKKADLSDETVKQSEEAFAAMMAGQTELEKEVSARKFNVDVAHMKTVFVKEKVTQAEYETLKCFNNAKDLEKYEIVSADKIIGVAALGGMLAEPEEEGLPPKGVIPPNPLDEV